MDYNHEIEPFEHLRQGTNTKADENTSKQCSNMFGVIARPGCGATTTVEVQFDIRYMIILITSYVVSRMIRESSSSGSGSRSSNDNAAAV